MYSHGGPVGSLRSTGRLAALLVTASAVLTPTVASSRAPVPVGAEFQINTYTTGEQGLAAAVAIDADGNFLMAWRDGARGGVFGQHYNHEGLELGSEFQLSTYTTGSQSSPAVTATGASGFITVWAGEGAGDTSGVFGQRFDGTGAPIGTEFQVNSYTTGLQQSPAVAASPDGGFLVVWHRFGGADDVFGRRYDSGGAAVGGEFQVSTYTTDQQRAASITADAAGRYTVVWTSGSNVGDLDVRGQRYDSGGTPIGGEFLVNTYTTSQQGLPAVGANGTGDFVVAWQSYAQDGSSTGIFGQRYNSAGTAVSAEFQVNTYTPGAQGAPSVIVEDAGSFILAWESAGQDGSLGGIFGQRFKATGGRTGGEFCVNTYTTSSQSGPAMTANAAGDVAIVWRSFATGSAGQDGSGSGGFARRYSVAISTPATSAWGALSLGLLLAVVLMRAVRRRLRVVTDGPVQPTRSRSA